MKRIAVLFSGKGSNFAAIVEQLHQKELDIVVALTNNPKAEGIEIAHRYHIPLYIVDSQAYKSREMFDQRIVSILLEAQVDLTVLAGFMRILTPIFTEQIKAINLHPSLLPRHKGLHAIEKSFADNHTKGGVTVHWVSLDLDGGENILQKEVLKKDLDREDYHQIIRKVEKQTLIKAIKRVLSLT